MDPEQMSQVFLTQIRSETDPAETIRSLERLNKKQLNVFLDTDSKKKTFWINLYNAFSLYFLKANPTVMRTNKLRIRHFSKAQCRVAGLHLSLNDIEHGILRKSKIWWSKGYLNTWFPSQDEVKFRVECLDPRIHFALNCGGKSCPPIRFYNSEDLENQLNLATESFLLSSSEYVKDLNIVKVSRILDWFIGDFGGKTGLLSFLTRYRIVPSNQKTTIRFKKYDWNVALDSFE